VKQLIYTLLSSDDSAAEDMMERLQVRVSSLSGVRLERSADALGVLWEGISKGKAVAVDKELSIVPPVSLCRRRFIQPLAESSQQQGPLSKIPGSVKVALLHSIHTGTFADYQCLAKSSSRHKVTLRPIYLSTVAAGEWSRLILNGMRCMVPLCSDGLPVAGIQSRFRWPMMETLVLSVKLTAT